MDVIFSCTKHFTKVLNNKKKHITPHQSNMLYEFIQEVHKLIKSFNYLHLIIINNINI